jgi:hypothetical protein
MKRVLFVAAIAALLAGPAMAQQMRGGSFDGSPGMRGGSMSSGGSMRPMRHSKKMMHRGRMHRKPMMHRRHKMMRSM